jgi:hypothetical protein
MKIKSALWVSILAMVATFTSCSKDPIANLTSEESRIYITDHDSTKDFRNFTTYSISDSVAVLNNGQPSKQQNEVDLAFINAVKTEMQNAGYTLVSKGSSPDLAINITRIYNTSTGIISYSNYYDYYGSYWDPYDYGYGGFGYYSPYSYATYSIRQGAISIDMLNLKDAPAANRIEVIWTGLIRGSGIFDATTAANQVNMLFNQSPYLKIK